MFKMVFLHGMSSDRVSVNLVFKLAFYISIIVANSVKSTRIEFLCINCIMCRTVVLHIDWVR